MLLSKVAMDIEAKHTSNGIQNGDIMMSHKNVENYAIT